eukprot:4810455-Pleurochrysis_carterae.AAC.2
MCLVSLRSESCFQVWTIWHGRMLPASRHSILPYLAQASHLMRAVASCDGDGVVAHLEEEASCRAARASCREAGRFVDRWMGGQVGTWVGRYTDGWVGTLVGGVGGQVGRW